MVAIPEGLPLAVTISLAYSVKRMQSDMNLVRVMAACETMGGATNICSDKTGTLTQNLMTVNEGYMGGKFWKELPKRADFEMSYLDTLVTSIACNSKGELGKDLPNGRIEMIGNKTECAMLVFLRGLGFDYRAERAKTDVARSFPFSSAKKRMSTLVRNPAGGTSGRLYTKGASEIVAATCSSYLAKDGSRQELDAAMQKEIMEHIEGMAGHGLRTIGIAFSDIEDVEVVRQLEDAPPAEMRMTFIAVLGIRDPPREASPPPLAQCSASPLAFAASLAFPLDPRARADLIWYVAERL